MEKVLFPAMALDPNTPGVPFENMFYCSVVKYRPSRPCPHLLCDAMSLLLPRRSSICFSASLSPGCLVMSCDRKCSGGDVRVLQSQGHRGIVAFTSFLSESSHWAREPALAAWKGHLPGNLGVMAGSPGQLPDMWPRRTSQAPPASP